MPYTPEPATADLVERLQKMLAPAGELVSLQAPGWDSPKAKVFILYSDGSAETFTLDAARRFLRFLEESHERGLLAGS